MTEESYFEIIERIKSSSRSGILSLHDEIDKFLGTIDSELKKLQEIANSYKKSIESDKVRWERIKEEIGVLETNRDSLKAREDEINKRASKVDEEEENLIELHRILENRKKIINNREKDLSLKERRLQEL